MKKISHSDIERIAKGIGAFAASAGSQGRPAKCVIGVSGGVDSAACLALCAKAVGRENVIAVFMPSRFTPEQDANDAAGLCKSLGISMLEVQMQGLLDAACAAYSAGEEMDKKAKGNVLARLRMACLYARANMAGGVVVGTGDRSEIEIGYFTKYGDGGCDFLPIGNYYKTQVRQIALLLGIDRRIAEKPSSPRLWEGHQASDEIGQDYASLDAMLELLDGKKEKEAAEKFGAGAVKKIRALMAAGRHKKEMPPAL